jgi:hypothetical protein
MLRTDVCDHLSAIGGGFSSHLQASNFDELMVGEPVALCSASSICSIRIVPSDLNPHHQ